MTEPRETKKSSQTVGFSRTITGLHPENELTQTTTTGRKQSSAIHIAIYRNHTANGRSSSETLLLASCLFRLRRRFLSCAALREQTANHVAEQLGRPGASCEPCVHQPVGGKFLRLRHYSLLDLGHGSIVQRLHIRKAHEFAGFRWRQVNIDRHIH